MFFNNAYLLEFTSHSKNKESGALFFHGFPGRTTRNEDLAEKVNLLTGFDSWVLHYPGLGKSQGEFRFSQCLDVGISLSQHLSSLYQKIHIIGHSWGGYVATQVYSQLQDHKGHLVLLNPLLEIFKPDITEQFIRNALDEPKLKTSFERNPSFISELLNDSEELRRKPSSLSLLKNLENQNKKIHIALTEKDQVLPAKLTLEKLKDTHFNIHHFKGDHWFTDQRENVAELIAQIISN